MKAKPAGTKGQYIRAATLSSTMGPGIHLDVPPLLELAARTEAEREHFDALGAKDKVAKYRS